MGTIVGIDLGTTYSAVAYVSPLGKPEILENRDGARLTPSVVMFQDDQPLVGQMAKNSIPMAPDDVVQFVKRFMGDPSWLYHSSSGVEYRPEDVSAMILKRLAEDARYALGTDVEEAVITVPAYFDDARRKATQDAGEIAGLQVRRIINEPTAAALAYGLDIDEKQTILVYDLGGGTFDVTVMTITSGSFEVIATDGDRNLGGFDWDNRTMQWLNEQYTDAGGSDLLDGGPLEADLREKSESAKRSLTSVASTKVMLAADGFVQPIAITRDIFDDLTSKLLERTTGLVEDVLNDAGQTWDSIDQILLVGGSTRMPQVRVMLERLAGKPAERGANPDEIVALGAAIQAHLVAVEDHATSSALPELRPDGSPIHVQDVTSQSLGLLVLDSAYRQVNDILIPRNSNIPFTIRKQYYTVSDGQTELRVEVTEGDDTDPDYVTRIGEAIVSFPPYPASAPVDVEYAYDIDQTIFIQVFDRTTGKLVGNFSIDRIANLSDEEIALKAAHIRDVSVE